MMRRSPYKSFIPVVILFAIINALLISFNKKLETRGMDGDVVIVGNALLFLITLLSFVVGVKGIKDPNPHAFVRSVMGGMMIKLFACIIAAFIYIYMAGNNINKAALFACMGLYLLYTFLEVSLLMKLMRKPNE
jgi:hypothetical protein